MWYLGVADTKAIFFHSPVIAADQFHSLMETKKEHL